MEIILIVHTPYGTVGFLVISARGRGAFIVSDIYSN